MQRVEEGVGRGHAGVEELRSRRGMEGAIGGWELEEDRGEVEGGGWCEGAFGPEEHRRHGGWRRGGEIGVFISESRTSGLNIFASMTLDWYRSWLESNLFVVNIFEHGRKIASELWLSHCNPR